MLVIRMQRTGRRGLAHYRLVVQDARQAPSSGRTVALLGSYNPHTKNIQLDKEKAKSYLNNGAQPSERVALLLKQQGIKLPKWVKKATKKKATIKNPDKLRKNRPAEVKPAEAEKPTEMQEEVKNQDTDVQPVKSEPEAVADSPEAETEPTNKPATQPSEEPKSETSDEPKADNPDTKKDKEA